MTRLTDRTQLARNRIRAVRIGLADFLHHAASDNLRERLGEINKRFTKPVVVTGLPDLWARLWPEARIVADDETLDLKPQSSDLVIHAMALHWADDPVGQLIQCRRALRPDGLFLSCLAGGKTLATLRRVLAEAESAVSGGLSPRVAPMAEIRDMGGLLQRAGFAMPVADGVALNVTYPDLMAMLHDLRAMGETNALANRHRAPGLRKLFDHAAMTYPKDPSGRLAMEVEILYLSGWAPAEGQPQPLRPGSAQSRLAEALGTSELTLPTGPRPKGDN